MKAPFPYFGGKRTVAHLIWQALGEVKQYVEPFCGSAAVLLACPSPASLEVIGDQSCYVANFWRAVKFRSGEVAGWADYPVSHIDLAARHAWLTQPERVGRLIASLLDPEWPGDAQIAGWWVWGQCAWIGSGWCEKPVQASVGSKKPHVSNAERGVQSQIPHVGDAGMGIQSKIPHVGDAGRVVQGAAATARGEHIRQIMVALARRLEDVRVIHGAWDRCLNMHYGDGGRRAGVLLDPPYAAYERLYRHAEPVAHECAGWAAGNGHARVVLCGHAGDYDDLLPAGWRIVRWSRGRLTYGGGKTTDAEALYLSPACAPVDGEEPLRSVSVQVPDWDDEEYVLTPRVR
jgi:hypothetical protein